jgi:hypothetical protein
MHATVQVMKSRKEKEAIELSQMQITLSAFLESYNQNIPANFPRASVTILKKFQITHPMLFKNGDMWSIAQHRKKLIDWLSGYRDAS